MHTIFSLNSVKKIIITKWIQNIDSFAQLNE